MSKTSLRMNTTWTVHVNHLPFPFFKKYHQEILEKKDDNALSDKLFKTDPSTSFAYKD